jgi:hypothetical protein
MLVTVRDRVAALKKQGKSLNEIISTKPPDAFESKWGKSLLDGALLRVWFTPVCEEYR